MRNATLTVALFVSISAFAFHNVTAQPGTETTCSPGEFKDGNDCKKCPANTYSSVANATRCIPCPPRRVSKPGSRAFELCTFCGPGRFFDETASKPKCERCPIDTFNSRKDVSKCTPCPSGRASSVGTTTRKNCRVCPVGTVVFRRQRPDSMIECRSCPLGQSTFVESADVCSDCPKGTFRDRFSPGFSCQPCRVGSFSDKTGNTACQPCPRGFFQNELGAVKCKKCPKNSTTLRPGGRTCRLLCLPSSPGCNVIACLPGFGLNVAKQMCEKCPAGQISPTLSTTPCFPCPVGDGTVNAARTKCVCTPGFRLRRDGTCEKCESGFSNDDGDKCMCVLNDRITEECECPPLTKQVRNRCVPCIPKFDDDCETCSGGESFNKSERRCEMCPANTFSSDGTRCRPCIGDSTSMPGSFSCDCGRGKGLQNKKCEPCQPGTFSPKNPVFRDLTCQKCFDGFSDEVGAEKCKRCPTRLTPVKSGATSCLPECPANARRDDLPFSAKCSCKFGFKNTGSGGELVCTRKER